MQSRRVWLPGCLDVVPFARSDRRSVGCAIADPDGDDLAADDRHIAGRPEGGFTDGELDSCRASRVGFSATCCEWKRRQSPRRSC